MEKRKFAKNLRGVGAAATIRENVLKDLKENSALSTAKLVEPLDYENVIVKNKTLLQNDPQREMLLFPHDDLSQSELPRRLRTVQSSVPANAFKEASQLLARECIKAYTSKWSVIHFKYIGYSDSHLQLPKLPNMGALPQQVFEIDLESEGKDEQDSALRSRHTTLVKKGWLLKGPDSNQETNIVSFTRSFKRRFFYLKQQSDATHVLEFHKDDKRMEAKGAIYLDSAVDVNKNAKKSKLAFDIQMQEKGCHVFAAESEAELEEWVAVLKKVIHTEAQCQVPPQAFLDRLKDKESELSIGRAESFRDSIEYSMNPELQKYARESDSMLAGSRKEGRCNIFLLYADIQRPLPVSDVINDWNNSADHDSDVYKEQFGMRFIVRCEGFKLRLQANLSDDGQEERLDNPEPFFLSFSLYNAKEGRKISEDFHIDPNSAEIRSMIPNDLTRSNSVSVNGTATSNKSGEQALNGPDPRWLELQKQAVFSVSRPDPDIFLVVRIEKVLQGSISAALEQYLRTTEVKSGTKIHKSMELFCQRLGMYHMPFAWGARPLFRKFSSELDTTADFVIYRAEGSRMCEDEIVKQLLDMRRADRQAKQQPFQGIVMKVSVQNFKAAPSTLTTSLLPVRPFEDPAKNGCITREVEEFAGDNDGMSAFPHTSYLNHLYIHLRSLKYDGQKTFTKARNIACCIEVRESDEEGTSPLKIIYGYPWSSSVWMTSATTTVLHHNTSPDFLDEVKVGLPTQLHDKHHILFTFYHISCDSLAKSVSKKGHGIENVVGYAWFPVLVNGRVNVGEQSIRVAANLPPSYLASEQLSSGRMSTANDIKWVDGGRPLFKFALVLSSTVYTKDLHLHNFFTHCQKLENFTAPEVDSDMQARFKMISGRESVSSTGSGDGVANLSRTGNKAKEEMLNFVKSLHAVDVGALISFLPQLLTQLLRLTTRSLSEDVAIQAVRVIIHIVHVVYEAEKTNILQSYVKYVFVTETMAGPKPKTVHEELAKYLKMTMRPNLADQLVVGKFLRHSWFFFEILTKSMAQYLLSTDRIKMSRNERFPPSFQFDIETLVPSLCQHIAQKYRELPREIRIANSSLAQFIKRCFTFMDRGFVFRLINRYMENCTPADAKVHHELKFEFLRVVCNHEHYIPLNLPMMRKQIKNFKEVRLEDVKQDYTLSEEYQKNHFLTGLLLTEVKSALNEVQDIRKYAIKTLRNLLAKHSFDDRYVSKAAQSRIAALYLPLITIILENRTRLSPATKDTVQPSISVMSNGGNDATVQSQDSASRQGSSLGMYNSQMSLDSSSIGSGITSVSQQRPTVRDPNIFSIISGQALTIPQGLPDLKLQHHGSSSSLASSACSVQSGGTEKNVDDISLKDGKCDSTLTDTRSLPLPASEPLTLNGNNSVRSVSAYQPASGDHNKRVMAKSKKKQKASEATFVSHSPGLMSLFNKSYSVVGASTYCNRYDKLDQLEIKDLLLCFLYIVKNLSEEILLGWLNNLSDYDVLDFFGLLELSMDLFKYVGKKRIESLCAISDSRRSVNVSSKKHISFAGRVSGVHLGRGDNFTEELSSGGGSASQAEPKIVNPAALEANLSVEVAMTVLDTVNLYVGSFKDVLQDNEGENPLMHKVFDLYLMFPQNSQSEVIQKHAFAALRVFITKFPKVLFLGQAIMCGRLCKELLRCCSSRLDQTRMEACAVMYLLMRRNFEFSNNKSFTRVHLQMIIAVSQIVGDNVLICHTRFNESLSVISSYATNDKAVQRTNFAVEVKDLTKCIRTVLMATSQMKEHRNDPEKLIDLHYSLAKSYTSTPELRKAWLENMARTHESRGNFSEAAHCYIHIAALIAEYLKRRGTLGCEFPQGCTVFRTISPNVESEESGMRDDSGMQDASYSEDYLTSLLVVCAQMLEKAERYELLGEIYRLIIPIYERKRDFEKLADAYELLHRAYCKIVDVMHSGKRLLGKYFRVAFYGQAFDDEQGKEYVYKEPKITGLTEICERLHAIYSSKFGQGNVHLIRDSNKVNTGDLDPKFVYIQVTHVTPYFDEKELLERQTDFERNNNIRRFMFETPFTKDGKAHGEIENQWRRRTIITTSHSFPYVKKRIIVAYHKDEELSPVEVAVEDMKAKVVELSEVVNHPKRDLKKLQLKLQGSVSVQVNAGPLAYAEAFLARDKVLKFRHDKVGALKEHFRNFVQICSEALSLNGTLISPDQIDYHDSLVKNFNEMVTRLEEMFGERLLDDEDRISICSNRNSVAYGNPSGMPVQI